MRDPGKIVSETYEITLRFSIDPSQAEEPQHWDWATLLDLDDAKVLAHRCVDYKMEDE